MSVTKLVVLALGAITILLVSIPSLRAHWKHAVSRALAFLLVLVVALLNSEYWFASPPTPVQIVAWLLLFSSIPVALHALYLLRLHGNPNGNIDYTRSLVDRGIYRYIRHPLYLSLLLLLFGAFLKRVTPLTLTLALAGAALLYLTARLEEPFNISKFGDGYVDYMKRTKMFIPWLL